MTARRLLYLLIFPAIFGFAGIPLAGQSPPLETISLLCDREVYFSGEILSFSAILQQSSPTDIPLSTTLYLEVLDGNGKSVGAQKHTITDDGRSYGSMELSSILPTGAYFVRAYTQYQKNLPPESHATQLIFIINPDVGIESIPAAAESALTFRFDGKSPIAGLSNVLVVRTNNPLPLQILNEQNLEIGKLLSTVGGFQLWEIPVESHESLRIESRDSTKTLPQNAFPAAQLEGIMASVTRSETAISAVFYPAPAMMASPTAEFQVELYDRNYQLISSYNHNLKTDGFRFSSPKATSGFPEAYLVLRSNEGRVVYANMIPETSQIESEAEVTPLLYSTREEVTLPGTNQEAGLQAVSVRKKFPIPAQMILDIAWTNPWMIPNMMIPDSLLPFTSALFQHYLGEKGPDLFGQRRDDWLPESRDLGISGVIRTNRTEEPAEGVLVVVSVVGEDPQIHPQTTDEHGRFQLPLRNLSGTETIFLGMKEPSGLDLKMLVNRDFRPEVPPIQPVPFTHTEEFHQQVVELFIFVQLTREYQQPPVTELLPAKNIPSLPTNLGSPDVSVKISDFIDLPSVEEVILNVIPKVSLDRSGEELAMNVYEDRTLAIHKNPLVLLDYAAVFDLEALLELSPAKLNRFDIYQGEYFLGDHKFTGIVSILTHTNDFARYPFEEYGAFVQLKTIQSDAGVSTAETLTLPESVPDFRPVLYWHPANNAPITFRTSDWDGAYEVIVQENGAISERQEFNVGRGLEN